MYEPLSLAPVFTSAQKPNWLDAQNSSHECKRKALEPWKFQKDAAVVKS